MVADRISAPERIGKTVIVLFALFFSSTLLIGGYTIWVAYQFQGLQSQWKEFSDASARKGELLNNLKSSAGYSGFIHNFKNYVIRGDLSYRTAALSDFDTVESFINEYRSLDLSAPEIRAIHDIEQTLIEYRDKIFVIDRMIGDGADIAAIDSQVAVDDRSATTALDVLKTAWLAAYTANQVRMDERIRTTSSLSDIVILVVSIATAMAILTFMYTRQLQRRLGETMGDLEASEWRFRGMVEHSSDAVISISRSGAIESFNGAAEKMFGYKASEILNENIQVLLQSDTPDIWRKATTPDSPPTLRAIHRNGNLLGRKMDGSSFELELDIAPFEAAGETKFIGTLRDVTARRKAERELVAALDTAEHALETRSRFFANVSHELRTPLNAIIGFSEAMSLKLLGEGISAPYQNYAEHIHAAGDHLSSIVSNILDISKIESEEFELDLQENNLTAITDDAVDMIEQNFRSGHISIIKNYDDGLPAVRCDRTRTIQILLNLLDNAAKFTPEGGDIRINLRKRNAGEVSVLISDNGIGIAEEQIPNALSPFGQVRSDIARENEGTGLGLPLAKRLVEQHGGVFEFESEVGKGTTVTFTLPVSR